jgi:1-acyl-sn-glycerol-3-phosphate acyltransferase
MHSKPALRERILFGAVIVQLGAMLLAWAIAAPLVALCMGRHRGGVVGRAAIGLIHRCAWASAQAFGLMRIDADALDALAGEEGGLIVAANHPSMLDALVVVAHLPRGVCVVKAELMGNVFLGSGARLANYIRDDSGRTMVRDAVRTLRDGNQLVCFPEGTRTARWPVNAFKSGLTLIASRAGVPIQTVIIEMRSPYLRKGWPLLRAPPMPVRIRMRLGKRFVPDRDHRAMRARLETYFAHELGQ